MKPSPKTTSKGGGQPELLIEIRVGRVAAILPAGLWPKVKSPLLGMVEAELLEMKEPERSFRAFWKMSERHNPWVLKP